MSISWVFGNLLSVSLEVMPGKGGTKQAVMFQVSGLIGTVLFKWLYDFMLIYLPAALFARATVAWWGSYFASILWQHALHRNLVFGYEQDYLGSLWRCYVSYGASLVLSTIFNYVLIEVLLVSDDAAWYISLIATGIINYFTVSNYAFGGKVKK